MGKFKKAKNYARSLNLKSKVEWYKFYEDTFQEILDRFEILGHKREDITGVKNLRFITLDSEGTLPKMNEGYEGFIQKWINEVEKFSDEPVLIVTDTYPKVQSFTDQGKHKMSPYSLDVSNLGPVQKILKTENVVGMFSTHFTKQKHSEEWNDIMNSTGIMATSDQAIIMGGRVVG